MMSIALKSLGVSDLENVDLTKYMAGEYKNDSSVQKFIFRWKWFIVKGTVGDTFERDTKYILKAIIKKIAELGRSIDLLGKKKCSFDLQNDIWNSLEVKKAAELTIKPVPALDASMLRVSARAIKTILDDAGFVCQTDMNDKEEMKINLEWSSSDIFSTKTFIRILPGENQILLKLAQLQKQQQFCDVTLEAEGREFPAHRFVLAANSEMFGTLLLSGMKESSSQKIVLEMKAKNLEKLLELLYTGQTALYAVVKNYYNFSRK